MTESKTASIPATLYGLSIHLQKSYPNANYAYLYALQTRHSLFESVGSNLYDIEDCSAVFENYVQARLNGLTVPASVAQAKTTTKL